jgi:hypothetical protein
MVTITGRIVGDDLSDFGDFGQAKGPPHLRNRQVIDSARILEVQASDPTADENFTVHVSKEKDYPIFAITYGRVYPRSAFSRSTLQLRSTA